MRIENKLQLRELYGKASKRALEKELTALEQHSMKFLSLSPFAVVSTYGSNGKVDSSPRGGEAGFARVVDSKTIAIADARGNNRLDSLLNIIETGQIGCLFMIPGIDETLRINGSAYISINPSDLKYSSGDKNPPKTVIVISIEEVYLHCAKAMMRSKLWCSRSKKERDVLPTMGRMIADQVNDDSVVETQDEMIKRYKEQL